MKQTNLRIVLNAMELEVLNRGAQEEAAKDVRIHSAMKNETGDLLDQYYNHFQECDIEVVVAVLLDFYDFWSVYFSCGKDEAFRLYNLRHQR